MTFLNHLVDVVESWPTTTEEMRLCSGGMFTFTRDSAGEVIAVTEYPLKYEVVNYNDWEAENVKLLAPMVKMMLERISYDNFR